MITIGSATSELDFKNNIDSKYKDYKLSSLFFILDTKKIYANGEYYEFLPLTGGVINGNITVNNLYIKGTANSTGCISSDSPKIMYISIDSKPILVADMGSSSVRPPLNTNIYNLGTTSSRWNTVYTNTLNVTSNSRVTNLNADMLDGKHYDDIIKQKIPETLLIISEESYNGTYGPIDMALMDMLRGNRFAFLPAKLIDIEYSRDAGETWLDFEVDDLTKNSLTLITNRHSRLLIGNAVLNENIITTSDYMLRVTFNLTSSIYTSLHKFIIYCNINGSINCQVTIEKRYKDEDYELIGTYGISGWSGYNVINIPPIIVGNVSSLTEKHYAYLRFTFFCKEHTSTQYSGLLIYSIAAYGGCGWSCPSDLAYSGHLYHIENTKDATFPKNVNCIEVSTNVLNFKTGEKLKASTNKTIPFICSLKENEEPLNLACGGLLINSEYANHIDKVPTYGLYVNGETVLNDTVSINNIKIDDETEEFITLTENNKLSKLFVKLPISYMMSYNIYGDNTVEIAKLKYDEYIEMTNWDFVRNFNHNQDTLILNYGGNKFMRMINYKSKVITGQNIPELEFQFLNIEDNEIKIYKAIYDVTNGEIENIGANFIISTI